MLRTARRRRAKDGGVWYPRWFWPSFAAPGAVWLLVLFAGANGLLESFAAPGDTITWFPNEYDDLTFRGADGQMYQTPSPMLKYDQIFGTNALLGPPFLRTFLYVAMASAICLLIAYPVAYYVARYAGRRRGMLLVLLIAPFWISYMMRMLAWVNLLGNDGLVNRSLTSLHLVGHPVAWLSGRPITVVLGLVYGYIPYMILPLFAGLDRIDTNLLEAARDLGANRARTFARVTLPLSKQAILAGMVIVALPMFGDYFTNDLLSGSPKTSMIGNLIADSVGTPGQGTNAAVLVLILTVILIIPMLYYVSSTGRATRERSG